MILKGKTFIMKALNPQTITLPAGTPLSKVEKEGAIIANKRKYRAVIVQFGGRKNTSEISLVDTKKFRNMGPGHPQFVRLIPGSSFAAVRSAMVI
jgi:hypothetical protein